MLPDGLRLFDRLTGTSWSPTPACCAGMDRASSSPSAPPSCSPPSASPTPQGKLVVDYSAGMTKKVTLACALVHAPRLLVLDEPFEAVDPVSAATIRQHPRRLRRVRRHRRPLEPRDGPRRAHLHHVAVIADGRVLAAGDLDDVRGGRHAWRSGSSTSSAGRTEVEGLSWLRTSSD